MLVATEDEGKLRVKATQQDILTFASHSHSENLFSDLIIYSVVFDAKRQITCREESPSARQLKIRTCCSFFLLFVVPYRHG